MYKLDHKESWAQKNGYFRIVVLEKTLESPLDFKEITWVNPKGNQPWIFIGRADAEAEAPILWPLNVKRWLIGKDSDAGKDWRQKQKREIEDKMVRYHHQLNRYEFAQTLGDSDVQGGLVHGVTKSWTRSGTEHQIRLYKYIGVIVFINVIFPLNSHHCESRGCVFLEHYRLPRVYHWAWQMIGNKSHCCWMLCEGIPPVLQAANDDSENDDEV